MRASQHTGSVMPDAESSASDAHGLRSWLQRHEQSGVGSRVIFGALAALLFVLEIVSGTPSSTPAGMEFTFLVCLALALAGWLPVIGGGLYVISMLASIVIPDQYVTLTLPILGLYAVCAEWVSRRWYVPAALAFVVVEGAQMATTTSVTGELYGMALGAAIVLGAGFGIQWSKRHAAALEDRATAAEYQAEEARGARDAVARGLARALHDTASRDLARIIMTSQSIARRSTDRAAAEDAEHLTELASHAMRSIRSLMSDADDTDSSSRRPLTEVIGECVQMLTGRGITMTADLPESPDTLFPPRSLAVLNLAVQEGAANVLKYARENSSAYLTVEQLPDGGVGLTLVNEISPVSQDARGALSGGYGLDNLSEVVAGEGGTVHYGSSGAMWRLVVSVPAPTLPAALPTGPPQQPTKRREPTTETLPEARP